MIISFIFHRLIVVCYGRKLQKQTFSPLHLMMICKTARQSVPGCAKLSRREQCFIGKRFASDLTLGVLLFKRPYFINISAAHVPTIYLANNDEILFITSDFLSHYQNLSQYRGKKKSAPRNANFERVSCFHL